MTNNQGVFFELVRAGLWEREARLSQYDNIDYSAILRLAEEQSVVGLITAGLGHVVAVKVPQEDMLQSIGSTLQIEQRNKAMNEYVAKLIDKLRKEDIYAILVKGQGIAQCYERPLWRASGDVDLLLSDTNYNRAKKVLTPIAVSVESEYKSLKHLGMTMKDGYVVELHGTLHSRLFKRIDNVIDEAQDDVFYGGCVRSWINGNTQVFLPGPNNDVIFVFTHILNHFYIEGIGLRQLCDWCRLLWTYRDSIDKKLLEKRIAAADLISEWKAFAALAVDLLGMPVDAMPLYSSEKKWSKKAEKIISFVLETGNFGHNREIKTSSNFMIWKITSLGRKMKDFTRHISIFPLDSIKFFFHFVGDGIRIAMNKLVVTEVR